MQAKLNAARRSPRPRALSTFTIRALAEQGHRVPEDISVIGYDDTLLAAFVPPLTTVHQNCAMMADCWHASRWT